MAQALESLCQHTRETALLNSAIETLAWDERTMLPERGGAYRAEQMTYLAGLVHRRRTDPRVGEWLAELATSDLAADLHSDAGATIRNLRREYDKQRKLPQKLVEALTRATVLGQQSWVAARKADRFADFAPQLAEIIKLSREKADALGYQQARYDALLDEYEPHAVTSEVARVLAGLRKELVPLVEGIVGGSRKPELSILKRHFPKTAQEKFGTEAAARIGFDFSRGRLDVTSHPFCTTLGPDDCRITTRYDERFFPSAFFGILHEAGHGIYEQGLRGDWFGLPPGEAISLGIHESQSRLWENLVGRGLPFWRHFYPQAQAAFPQALGDVPLDAFHFAINNVEPSLIRVEADEATYNLHILVRFELEQALINDDLSIGDLPGAWNEKYQSYLGIKPPADAVGVMQDIHWSAGLVGYFPTYSLGNLYAAQFFELADKEIGPLDEQFAGGEFRPLREWLREKIHRHGKCYTAAELVKNATGKPLSHDALMTRLRGTLGGLYGVG
ncbi:MAG: carboxypeptidase M32 [Planctomycetota bacterium]|nr:MAG: carboxypeptidase M32 [Planctomycetota bacterium]